MALNAEALECRAAAVQLQQQAQWILNKALEMEKQAAEQLAREMLKGETKTPPLEENSISDFKPEVQIDETPTSVDVSELKTNICSTRFHDASSHFRT